MTDERSGYERDEMRTHLVTTNVPGQWTAGPIHYSVVTRTADGFVVGALWIGDDNTAGFRHAPDDMKLQGFFASTILRAQSEPDWNASEFMRRWVEVVDLVGYTLGPLLDAPSLVNVPNG